jgi:hypothetical protein
VFTLIISLHPKPCIDWDEHWVWYGSVEFFWLEAWSERYPHSFDDIWFVIFAYIA